MADRNIVTFEEERNEHGPHWTLNIDRSAAGQPGLFFTIKTEMHSARDKLIESLNQELTVVAKDGVALLAPVLSWLLTPELIEEIAAEHVRRQGGTWSELTDNLRIMEGHRVRERLEALVAVGQNRIDDQYRVGAA